MKTMADFRAAYKHASHTWEPLDKVLLDACTSKPDHTDVSEVFAKVALVNRVYRANLHMGGKDAEWNLAKKLATAKFDDVLTVLRPLTFARETAPAIVEAHGKLVGLCESVTGRVANSFASKYLSFHVPDAVPIFDQYAYSSSWALVGKKCSGAWATGINEDYGWHAEAVVLLVEDLQTHGVASPSLKQIDIVLYTARGGTG